VLGGTDNANVRIPHSELAKQRIINLSRQPHSQVSQKIRLPNKGNTNIKMLLDDIQTEIRKGCPNLIDDGSKPFICHWTDIGKDDVEITIETHHQIPRLSATYWVNRQECLAAISRAIEKYKA
jgi:hypothetical protein